jgi:hypothetical protein
MEGNTESERSVLLEMMMTIVDLTWNSMALIGIICGKIIPE